MPRKTRQKTIHGYKELYQGPEFDIDYQYAQIYVLVVMAFTFGPLLPILIPMAFLGILIQYATIRMRIAYSVRRMPIYNQGSNKCMIRALSYTCISYLIMTAFLYSNQ